MSRLRLWFHGRWPWCVPYDGKSRVCFRSPVWNGRCAKHVRLASKMGEAI